MTKPNSKNRKRPSTKAKLGNGACRFRGKERSIRKNLDKILQRWKNYGDTGDSFGGSEFDNNKGKE